MAGNWARNIRHATVLAVPEPVTAGPEPPDGLSGHEQNFYRHLLSLPKGRLEQEFLPRETVTHMLSRWVNTNRH